MRESIKVVYIAIFMFAAPAAAVAWFDDRPNEVMRILRIVCPILSVLVIGLFLKMHFRADIVPDYLYPLVGNYFNRGGFCFGFKSIARNGICYIEACFQNQTDKPCRGRIALRPARGFWLGRAQISTVVFEIACEPAAFGKVSIAVPLPGQVQGKRQSFEVGASVDYPQGKGRTLRFRDGLALRANADFGNAFGTALTIAGAVTGQVVLSKPATVTMQLPANVAEDIPNPPQPEIVTFWKLGDPPLDRPGRS